MKTIQIFFFLMVVISAGCRNNKQINGIYVDFDEIRKVKKLIENNDKRFAGNYQQIIDNANMALNEGPFSVINKKRTPPSGDKHDYLSMGPYWWPDSTKADGLPYIRHDGLINPETRDEYVDTSGKNKMFQNTETLGWAYYFSEDKKYALKALELLETWFVKPETRMNPNLNFAQGIPGICDGRGIGIIDWARINKLITTIQILDANGFMQKETKTELWKWFEEYHTWLITHEYGRSEDDYFNNHGTWYDVQVTGIEMMLGKTEMAKARLERAKQKRIASQIEPDGSQPHELARTKSLGYSSMNLQAFIQLANLGKKLGVDLWNFESADGRSIKKAISFLQPIATKKKTWNYQQIADIDETIEGLKISFQIAGSVFKIDEFAGIAATIQNQSEKIEVLIYTIL